MYIGDAIGNEYKKWENGSTILLNAQTGRGKTYFILNTLLKYVTENDGFIFYFVNRKLLKKQIENDILKYETELSQNAICPLSNHIEVYTYQSIENESMYTKIKKRVSETWTYSKALNYSNPEKQAKIFFIYDECHYFYCDSTFNPKTEMSYYYLRDIIQQKYRQRNSNEEKKENEQEEQSEIYTGDKVLLPPSEESYDTQDYIEIFISATMEHMKDRIQKDRQDNQNIFSFPRRSYLFKTYESDFDYSYVNLNILDDKKRIPELIIKSKKKWLIFIDNKNYGKKLKDNLENSKIDVSYIDADYNDDEDAIQTVRHITKTSLSNKRVIISTAVLDNGVSIKDERLRNLIILVDNKETFMQMLGRIRINDNNEKLNLYICKKTRKYFEKRLNTLKKLNEFYHKYEKNILINTDLHPLTFKEKHIHEVKKLIEKQSRLLNDILSTPSTINFARKLCYSVNGLLSISSFSIQRCNQLVKFYIDTIERFNSQGENAFVYTVGEWLGKKNNEIEKSIIIQDMDNTVTYKGNIERVLSEKLSDKNKIMLSEDENKNLKNELLQDFLFFFNNIISPVSEETSDKKKIINNIKKNDRPISSKNFNTIMEIANLPYKLTNKKNVGYLLEKV